MGRGKHNIQYIDKNRQEFSQLPGKIFGLFPHEQCVIITQLDNYQRERVKVLNATEVNISRDHIRKLLATASPDAAMVYLYISCGNPIEGAEQALKMGAGRIGCAVATLRQLGLWEEPKKMVRPMIMG